MPAETTRPAFTLAEWLAEGERRFGADKMAWRFVCPQCGHEQTMADFKALSAGEHRIDPQRAYAECIGRVWGELPSLPGEVFELGREGQPCNWAAFGIFGTLNGGTKVTRESGKELWVFDFAEVADV